MQQPHRPGAFKQSNKTHKHGRHRSKGALDCLNKGKVDIKTITKRRKKQLGKMERRNKLNQIRAKKREEVVAKKRSFGGNTTAPILVAVIPLCASEDANKAIRILTSCSDENIVTSSCQGNTHLSVTRFKSRYTFVAPPAGDLIAVLDFAKVADTVLFLLSTNNFIDENGKMLLTALFAQGLPTSVHAVQGMGGFPQSQRHEIKKTLQKMVERKFPKEKVFSLDNENDGLLILRHISSQKQRNIVMRNRRSYLLAEDVRFETTDEETSEGTLLVSGYIR